MDQASSRKSVNLSPIGVIHSCFTEKFGVPRQANIIPEATASVELFPPFNRQEMVRGLERFSHIWIQFLFHQNIAEGWRPTVRPPWLGGRRRVGVLASRSPHRPNFLGLSAVRLEAVEDLGRGVILQISGVDLIDGTPVLDIKPYLPYSDCLTMATCGYAPGPQGEEAVVFTAESAAFCQTYQATTGRHLEALVAAVIRHDPRPASQKGKKVEFGLTLWDVNVRWMAQESGFLVISCEKLRAG